VLFDLDQKYFWVCLKEIFLDDDVHEYDGDDVVVLHVLEN
jgi:hypothetical protein